MLRIDFFKRRHWFTVVNSKYILYYLNAAFSCFVLEFFSKSLSTGWHTIIKIGLKVTMNPVYLLTFYREKFWKETHRHLMFKITRAKFNDFTVEVSSKMYIFWVWFSWESVCRWNIAFKNIIFMDQVFSCHSTGLTFTSRSKSSLQI